jgi:hypothetical protein
MNNLVMPDLIRHPAALCERHWIPAQGRDDK